MVTEFRVAREPFYPHGPIPFAPSHFVGITPFEAEKARLLGRHASQEHAMRKAVGAGFDKLCGRPDGPHAAKFPCDSGCPEQMNNREAHDA